MTSHHLKLLNANCRGWCLAYYLTAFTDWTVNITNLILLHYVVKVENILKGNLDSIPSPSVKIQIMGGKVCLRCKCKTLLGIVNKLLKTKKFVDITQQCFALLTQVNFPTHNLNEGDGIKFRLSS